MSKSAFPWDDPRHNRGEEGISQRLYIATKLLCATLSNQESTMERYKKFKDAKSELNFDEHIVKNMYEIADELIKWSELKDRGVISEEEFQRRKEKILSE